MTPVWGPKAVSSVSAAAIPEVPDAVQLAASAAGQHLAGQPRRVSLDLPRDPAILAVTSAVYLAYARDGTLHYVGKVGRLTGTVGQRISEHLRAGQHRRAAWRTLWIVPLSGISTEQLLTLERSLIRAFRPPGNIQHAAQSTDH